ncbi:MAG: GGDEF domain-containing protein, partial [Marinobacter sp.]
TDTMSSGEGSGDYLIGFSRLRDNEEYGGFGWLVMVRKPASTAFAPADELRLTLIVTGFAVAFLLILCAFFAARWTTRPLLRMTEEARNLDPEQPATLIKQRDDYEEVQTLSSTLRNLITSLTEKSHEMNELNTTLEHRVDERTRELENANALLEDEIVQRDAMRREREQLIRQLEETVRTDALTGLKNRRHCFELGETAVKKAVRSGAPLSAIMFDADYFKKVNDTYGHGVGDKALVHLSKFALETLRDIDVLARVGGEEFAVLLENTDEQGAGEVAERLRSAIESNPLPLERGRLTLTISAGVASFRPAPSDDLDALLLCADKALYQAKTGGRNRVCLYSEIQQATNG